MSMDKEKLKKYSSIAILALAVIVVSITYFFLLYKNRDISSIFENVLTVIRPIIIGSVIAYIMKSTCNFFENLFLKCFKKSGKHSAKGVRKAANIFSVVLAYIVWTIAISLLLWIAIPNIIESVVEFYRFLRNQIPTYIAWVIEWEQTFLKDSELLRPVFDEAVKAVTQWASVDLVETVKDFAFTQLVPSIISFVGTIFDVVIGLVVSVFILLNRKTLAKKSTLLLHCVFKKESIYESKVDDKLDDASSARLAEEEIIRLAHLPDEE